MIGVSVSPFVSVAMGGLTAGQALGAGRVRSRRLMVGGLWRYFMTYQPAGLAANADAVVLWHGGRGDPLKVAAQSQILGFADTHGFVVVLPSAGGSQWNDGRPGTAANADDVAFADALMAQLAGEGLINAARTWCAGISNGGMMTLRLAVERPALMAGYASVAANLPVDMQTAGGAAAQANLMMFCGMADARMPYTGGPVVSDVAGDVLGAQATRNIWTAKIGSPAVSETTIDDKADGTQVVRQIYVSAADADKFMAFYRIVNGGHNWPGGASGDPEINGLTTYEIHATAQMIQHFGIGRKAKAALALAMAEGLTSTARANRVAELLGDATTTTEWMEFTVAKGLTGSTEGASYPEGYFWRMGTYGPLQTTEAYHFAAYTAAGTTSRTYIAQDGLLKYDLAANQPRYTWKSGYRELLLEGAATNLIAYSSPLDTGWSRTGSPVVTRNAALAPTGVMEATRWQRTIGGPTYAVQFWSKASSALPYTLSFFARRGVTKCVAARIQGAYPARVDACFDLAAGSVVQSSANSWTGLSASMEPLANGWWRCSLSGTSDAHNAVSCCISPSSGTDAAQRQVDSTDPVASSDVYLYGAQLEAGLTATSYIPTGAAAVTRPIESFGLPAAILSIMQGAAVSAVVRGAAPYNAGVVRGIICAGDGTSANRLEMLLSYQRPRVGKATAGVAGELYVGAGLYADMQPFGVAAAWSSGASAAAASAMGSITDTVAGMPGAAITHAWLGRAGRPGVVELNGSLDLVAVWPSLLSTTRLTAVAVPYAA